MHFSANTTCSTFMKTNGMPHSHEHIVSTKNEIDESESIRPENRPTMAGEAAPFYERTAERHSNIGQQEEGRLFSPMNITIFEKLGRPTRYHRPSGIEPRSIPHELSVLRKLMLDNRIQLMVSSPNITDADLFRFLTSDFMDLRITDDGSPLFHCFLYDDYRPDPFFDNEQTALNRCIRLLLDKRLPCPKDIYLDSVTLNQYGPVSSTVALQLIEGFKSKYDEIVSMEINPGKTTIQEMSCEVTGSHSTGFIRGNKCLLRTGRWAVRFGLNGRAEWKIGSVRIEDVDI